MLKVGHQCPACGTFVRNEAEEHVHPCLRAGQVRYSVAYVSPDPECDAGNEYVLVLWGASDKVVTATLSEKTDPENYRVYEWAGHTRHRGIADDTGSMWGDEWMEAH